MGITSKQAVVFFVLFIAVDVFGLENASFENQDTLFGWKCIAYNDGQQPAILGDCNNFKEGRQSLLIRSKDPSDTAIVQKISLPADSLWQASCWVKTENLLAKDQTLTGGTLHIQTIDNGPVSGATSQFVTSDWRQIKTLFRVPVSGEAQVVLFFVGFGKGTGQVWFDDVKLEKLADAPTCVPVTGPNTFNVKLLDDIMLKYREKIGCTAATLAVSRRGRLLYRRGYGWSDREKLVPCHPDTMICIASCGKPIISAAIHKLAQKQVFALDSKLLDVLPTKPNPAITDERVKNITLDHLIKHTAGWGHEPRDKVIETIHKAGCKDPISTETFLSFIIAQPLENEPGTNGKYCNFAYDVLIDIVEKKSGKRAK
jgi:hypothetical protein